MPSWPTTPARARRTSSPASRPAGFQTPPSASLTATIRQPRRARAAAAWLPTLPKPWIATRAPAQRHPDRARGLTGDHRHALARRLHPADGPAELHRLARDDRRRVAVEPPVLVHQPRHLGRTRAHVGRHDVAHRAEHLLQPVHHGPGGALELGRREAPGVEVEPALGAAEGQARQRRLPGHPGRERAHAVQVDRRVVAQAPLVGPAGAVVLHAIGREQTETPVVQAEGHLRRDLAVGAAQHEPEVVVEAERVGGLAEGGRDGLELGGVGGAGGGQGISPGRAGRAILTDARRRAGTIDPWTRSPR